MNSIKWNPIHQDQIVDTILEYGRNNEVYLALYNKLQSDLNRRTKIKRERAVENALELFRKVLDVFDDNLDGILTYLCVMARMEAGKRESLTKFQFYHLFKLMLNIK